jgi:hypothetical protein
MTKDASYQDFPLEKLYEEVNLINKSDPDTAKRILEEISLRHEAINQHKSRLRKAAQKKKEKPGFFSAVMILVFSVFMLSSAYDDLIRGTAFILYDPMSVFSPHVKFGFRVAFGIMCLALSLWSLKQRFTKDNDED